MIQIPSSQKKRRANWFLSFSIFIIVIYIILHFIFPEIDQGIQNIFLDLKEYALNQGLWGMFVFSIAANATVFINIPYSSVAVLLAGFGINPWLVALSAGVGAMIGQVIDYFIGYGGSHIFARSQEMLFDKIRRLMSRRRYLTPLIIYLLAATPIPDYILLIPLGVIRYPFWKMIWPMLLGKITQNFYFALLGKYSLGQIDWNISGGGFYIGLSTLIIIFGAIYIVMRIDWDNLIDRWAAREEAKLNNESKEHLR